VKLIVVVLPTLMFAFWVWGIHPVALAVNVMGLAADGAQNA
jgi:hypothetical protein